MLHALRNKLNEPGNRIALAGILCSLGLRILVEAIKENHDELQALGELHRESRSRIFVLETLEEGKRIVEEVPDDESVINLDALRKRFGIADDDQATEQSTEGEIQ